ncbi:hypothetical protein VTJ49DRAFT_4247 [Mycothermus thermophilus]|uniref:Uncharacterized protein n=1 Tax=Humicola insolens TaxID=85995 RepID=A0ABR3VMD4_HUMIN
MMFKLDILSAVTSLLAVTALAAPLEGFSPAEVPHFLDARQATVACPTTTRWEAWWSTTVYLGTTTITNGIISIGPVTSTKTEKETRTIITRSTFYSPAVTTLPTTTLTTTVATATTDLTWTYFRTTVTSPGYAPSEFCQVTTITNTLPGTTSVTVTRDLSCVPLYATYWYSRVEHVTTVTDVSFTTSTITDTRPGSTAYATTVTQPVTYTTARVALATSTSVVWEKGCRSWACGL